MEGVYHEASNDCVGLAKVLPFVLSVACKAINDSLRHVAVQQEIDKSQNPYVKPPS